MKSPTRISISLCAAVITAALLFAYASSIENEISAGRLRALEGYGGKAVEALTAKKDIPAGSVLEPSLFEKVSWPAVLLPADVVVEPAELKGKVATALILAGEPVSGARTGSSSSALQVPRGFIAVSVPSEDVLAVGGAVRPGSIVDVYSVADGSALLLQSGVAVLETSAAEKTGGIASQRAPLSWVTLAVPGDSAQQVIAASGAGALHLALPSAGR